MPVVFRDFQPGDEAVLADLRLLAAKVDGHDPESTLESLPDAQAIESSALTTSDVDGSAFAVALLDGAVAGYVTIRSWDEESGIRLYLHNGFVDPGWRNRGVGTAIVAWAESRSMELAEVQGRVDAAVFGASATSSEPHNVGLLESNGYVDVFSLVEMRLDDFAVLESPQVHMGYEVRPALDADVHALWQLNEDVYAGRDFTSVATGESLARFRDATDVSSTIVALSQSGEPIAFVSSRKNAGNAEVLEVSVHSGHRHRGLARHLLTRNLQQLRDSGVATVRLHTNGEDVSGARSLYESMGFKTIKFHRRFRKHLSGDRGTPSRHLCSGPMEIVKGHRCASATKRSLVLALPTRSRPCGGTS